MYYLHIGYHTKGINLSSQKFFMVSLSLDMTSSKNFKLYFFQLIVFYKLFSPYRWNIHQTNNMHVSKGFIVISTSHILD